MAYVVWREEYSVGNPKFDGQHKGLFQMIDDLYVAMKDGKGNDVLSSLIWKLEDYTRIHFQEEELYLQSINFPGLEEQKREHKLFTNEIVRFKEDIANNKIGLSLKMVSFLENWLAHHIKEKDKEYDIFIASQK